MPRADQKRDKFGRFADEGRGDFSDMALVNRSRKRIIRWEKEIAILRVETDSRIRKLQGMIANEQSKINSLT